jgi:hypothetical protein
VLFWQLTVIRVYQGLPEKYPTLVVLDISKIQHSFSQKKKGTAPPGALFWQLTVMRVYQGLPKKYPTLVVLDISKIQHSFSQKKKGHCSSWGAPLTTDCYQDLPGVT